MTLEQLKNKAQHLISNAKIKEALDLLATWAHENNNAQLKSDVALKRADLTTLERQQTLGVISSSEASVRRNNITFQILELIQELNDESESKSFSDTSKNSNQDLESTLVPNSTPSKITILMLLASPTGTANLDFNSEHSAIARKLEGKQDMFTIKVRQAVTKADFKELTETIRPDILHFSGHGENSDAGGEGGLVVQNENRNGYELISANGLQILFEYFEEEGLNLKSVILNACYSEEQAKAIAAHVDYVIGTNINIGDKLATAFSTGFYFKLAETGLNFEKAFTSGRAQAALEGANKSHFVIYKNNQKLER